MDLKPHLSRYWLNAHPEDPVAFDQQVKTVGDVYEQGVHAVSTDEKTGIRTLQRKDPILPTPPGLIERRQFEYIRPMDLDQRSPQSACIGLLGRTVKSL